jgi:hypothetical protein
LALLVAGVVAAGGLLRLEAGQQHEAAVVGDATAAAQDAGSAWPQLFFPAVGLPEQALAVGRRPRDHLNEHPGLLSHAFVTGRIPRAAPDTMRFPARR